MDWHIPAISRTSFATQKDFAKGDRVTSILVKGEEGEVQRIDALESEEDALELPGEAVCRWTQPFKPKKMDDRAEKEAMKLTADNLFISLFENEEEPTQENAKLKQLLALMLERKRVLRVMERGEEYIHYIHRPTKKECFVPNVELDPQFFIENQERLSFLLLGGAADSNETGGSSEPESERPAQAANDS